MSQRDVVIAGVGMTPFSKPSAGHTYLEMATRAARAALEDAGVAYRDVQQAYAGYVYGDSTSGQNVLYELGLTGIPMVNVNNNCSTGSSALWLANQAVSSGAADCVLALGFEQMRPGALTNVWDDRPSPSQRSEVVALRHPDADPAAPMAAQLFGGAGVEHMRRFGTSPETFARVSVKARRHAAANPNAVFRDPLTVEQVLQSPQV